MKRTLDSVIERRLRSSGAVLIIGPKGCGKSTTGSQIAKNEVRLQDPENSDIVFTAKTNPSAVLRGEPPLLIDEWQIVPSIWDAVRSEVDRRKDMGQFILTGSSVPQDDGLRHSGVGRIAEIRMRTMSLCESGDSSGSVSLRDLFGGKPAADCRSKHKLEDIAFLTVRGGWPRSIGMDPEYAGDAAENYYNGTIGIDVFRVDGKKKDSGAVDRLMRSYSRNISAMASMKTIIDDVRTYEQAVSASTVENYTDALKRLYIIEDVPAWGPSIRSRETIRRTPKRHLADPSLAAASLKLGPERLMNDMNTFGLFFESLCVRDMRVYSQLLDGTVYHYHDGNDAEVDLIVQLRDGRWGAAEAKIGASGIESGVSNLLKLKSIAESSGYAPPSFMIILTATGYVSDLGNGVAVVPIGCLGP
ncbi:MAG: DUF4143 domain-containing protein [Candidatus Methanoplasma sp.]|jgi:predicted AAA+ superfamily ATPase|nr:DUF4143 domain-containing protein [Candidatus Methanoplasma sp.]